MNTRQFFSAFLNDYPISIRRRGKGTDLFYAPSNHGFGGEREQEIKWHMHLCIIPVSVLFVFFREFLPYIFYLHA